MSTPVGRKLPPTPQNIESGGGNDVMAELQAILRGRRATTEKIFGSPRAQRKFTEGGKSNSVSEKRFNSTEKLNESNEPEVASPLSPSSNTKWHVTPPKPQTSPSPKSGSLGNDSPRSGTATPPKRPLHPPLRSSPIPVPGSGTDLIPDPGFAGSGAAIESVQNRHKSVGLTTSLGATMSTSVVNNYTGSNSGSGSPQKAALTQSLPKSNITRVGPPPNAPPPRLTKQGNPVSQAQNTSVASLTVVSSNTGGKKSQVSKQSSPFPAKLTHKTSNITFNEPVKVAKKGAAKKAPAVTTKGPSSAGIKRLLFKKIGNKKVANNSPGGSSEPKNPKVKTDVKFSSRQLSPEVDQSSDSDSNAVTPRFPASSSIPTSPSTPAFGYQNVFDDEVFLRRNQHRIEEVPVDKKPKPLPRKMSVDNTLTQANARKSLLESYEMAAVARDEGSSHNAESPLHDRQDVDERFIGSPSQSLTIGAGSIPAERQPLAQSPSKSRPQSTSSLLKVMSPTSIAASQQSPLSPDAKPTASKTTDAFKPVEKMGSRVSIFSDLTKLPLFQQDPSLSVRIDQTSATSDSSTKSDPAKTASQALPGAVPFRRRSTPKEVRRAVQSEGSQADPTEGEEDYIAMNPIRLTSSMNFLEVSQETKFPLDPRASGYYLKILAPTDSAKENTKSADGELDECPSSPEPYDEVNIGPIITVPVIDSLKSPEDEYISMNMDRDSMYMVGDPQVLSDSAVKVDERVGARSPNKQFRRTSGQREAIKSPITSPTKPEAGIAQNQNRSRAQIKDAPSNLKYSDVMINPVNAKGDVVKRKVSAQKKFSYQSVQLEQGKKGAIKETEDLQDNATYSSKRHLADNQNVGVSKQKEASEPTNPITGVEGERKISLNAGVHSKLSTQGPSKVTSNQEQQEGTKDAQSRLADRPLPNVPKRGQQKQQKAEQDQQQATTARQTGDESDNVYYLTTSSFAGQSGKAGPPPLCVSIPGRAPSGRVVWHEYVEIDEEEIVKMGCALPPLPTQFLRLVPVLRNNSQPSTSAASNEQNWDFPDDVSDTCSIDRSDSIDSCPYIEPFLIGSPPEVPDRPDNLDEFIRQKTTKSGEYSYAAVPGQSFGVKWMKFQSSDPRHIRLAAFSSDSENSGYIVTGVPLTDDTDGSKGQTEDVKGSNPPVLPPKTASLLREQKLLPVGERPQSYLIPVFTNTEVGKGRGGKGREEDRSKSTGQLSTATDARDAATGERMETHKSDTNKPRTAPAPKPKPHKDYSLATKKQTGTNQEGTKIVLVDEGDVPYETDTIKIRPGKATLGHKALKREKSNSTGNVLETSSDFDTREKWIDSGTIRHDGRTNVAATALQVSQRLGQKPLHEQERGQPSKQSHKPFRSDAVKRKQRKTSDESMASDTDAQKQEKEKKMDQQSMAVIRRNRETIVKHLSRVLDADKINLEFGQSDESMATSRGASQAEKSRGLGDILSELDSLLKNKVFSTDDLLSAIQSKLNIKVSLKGDSSEHESDEGTSRERRASKSPQAEQQNEASNRTSGVGGADKANSSAHGEQTAKPLGGKAHYVNEELLPRMKGLKTVDYSPTYMNHEFHPEQDLAQNSQSSDISSSSNDSETGPRVSRYVNIDYWAEASEKSRSAFDVRDDIEASTRTTFIANSSTEEELESSQKYPPSKLSQRSRSQSSIDVSPKNRRKKISSPAGLSRKTEPDSPSSGYQLALQMEDERLGGHRLLVPPTESSRGYRQTSSIQSSLDTRPRTSSRSPYLSSTNDAPLQPPTSKSPGPFDQRRSRFSQPGQVSTKPSGGGEYYSTAGVGQQGRDSRSYSVGSNSFHSIGSRRRTTINTENDATGGQTTFMNGVGIFTHRGGTLMNAGSGVIIEVPEDAIPQGMKQKIWFEVKQDVFNPHHEQDTDASHQFTDSFQFHTGSTEFENYLAGKRERKVQLSPVILIGPSDAELLRPIKIKMPHCLPYQNNSWHLHMLAKAQTSTTKEWTELSNTIGLVELPPKKTGNKSYRKSSYQMHIDYTQVGVQIR